MDGRATVPGASGSSVARRSRPRYLRVQVYIAREFLFGFVVCFLFFFSVFFVNQILLMAEDILSKKAPLRDVLLLLVYATPSILAMAFPFAALVGALMAAGRLSSDNEMLALLASGVPAHRAFFPFVVLGLVFSLSSFVMNDVFLPLGTIEFGKLYRKLLTSTPALELKPYSVTRYRDISVVTGAASGGELDDILIFDRSGDGSSRVISARRASLSSDSATGDIILHLGEVWEQTVKNDKSDSFDWSRADEMEYRLTPRDGGIEQTSVGPRDMSSTDLAHVIAEKQKALDDRMSERGRKLLAARLRLYDDYQAALAAGLPWVNANSSLEADRSSIGSLSPPIVDHSLQVYRLELYKKYSIPFGALFFVFLAFPLGLGAKRSGRVVGFGLGMLISVLYWAFLLVGQTLGTRLEWSPFWAMWIPDALVFAAGIVFWARRRVRG